jgi:multidrug efflux pump subunit AcrA (membrane-fusion protein)
MCSSLAALAAGALGLALDGADAQSVREHTRPSYTRDTAVSESQAAALTLTLAPVARRTLQTWIRTAGELDPTGRMLIGCVGEPHAALPRVGQRVRAFPPDSKASIYQARVVGVVLQGQCVRVEAALSGASILPARYYVLEIIVDRGEFLAVPNEAIIEEGDRQVVYVQQHAGHYAPREVRTGLRGELYSEVLDGLDEGEEIVTFGSFFIDADYKLRAPVADATSNAHQHH